MADSLLDQLQASLSGTYTFERELAGGGMSRVFVATETALGRKVVIKVLPVDMVAVSLDRFRREIAMAARLQHAHIVPVLTAGDAGGVTYFVMPFIRGESLRSRLAKGGELPVAEAMRVLRDVAGALAAAHEMGIVHRDIKPDNVLLAGGAAMVTDFGVAKALTESATPGDMGRTSAGLAVGTSAYMSPEQTGGDPLVDHRADIYAWGVMAYELLTGTTPFSGRSVQAMLAAHLSEDPEPIARRRRSVPPALAALVMRCLEKLPADRPQHAEELVRALDDIVPSATSGDAPITASATWRIRQMGLRWRRQILGALAVVALALLVNAALLIRGARSGLGGARLDPMVVAVLGFEIVGNDSTIAYFAEGMRDELADALTRVPGISVVGRRSSLAVTGSMSVADAGRRLHAGSIVDASVRRVGRDSLRVQVELIDAADGLTRWSRGFPDAASKPLAAQADIVQGVTAALHVPATGDRPFVATAGTGNSAAYERYLQGLFALRRRTDSTSQEAMQRFREAIALDSTFAAPWAGMARSWITLADDWLAPRDAYPNAKVAAARALALDSTSAAARIGLGTIALYYDWDFAAAEREFRTALRIAPGSPESYHTLGLVLDRRGARDSALAEFRRSVAADPVSVGPVVALAWAYVWGNRLDSAEAAIGRARALDPSFASLAIITAQLRMIQGRWREALATLQQPSAFGTLAQSLRVICEARLGMTGDAHAHLAALERERSRRYVDAVYLAQGYAALPDRDAAFRWLEQAFRDRSGYLYDMSKLMPWDPIRSDPRFAALAARINASHPAP